MKQKETSELGRQASRKRNLFFPAVQETSNVEETLAQQFESKAKIGQEHHMIGMIKGYGPKGEHYFSDGSQYHNGTASMTLMPRPRPMRSKRLSSSSDESTKEFANSWCSMM